MATVKLPDKPDAPGMDKAVVIYGGKVYLADAETIREALQCLTPKGGTMTGALILADDPTEDMEAATKKYVDDICARMESAIGDISTALDAINGEVV